MVFCQSFLLEIFSGHLMLRIRLRQLLMNTETEANRQSANIHDLSLSWLGTDISIKREVGFN
jgi:hypothetical protein